MYTYLAIAQSTLEEQSSKKDIVMLIHALKEKKISTITARIESISAYFLKKPYLLGSLGEGHHGQFDQYPLFRTDVFDCETFVDTVLAIAFANDLPSFKKCIQAIRYEKGQVDFTHRNHFASLDWNVHNQNAGYLKDVTPYIKNKKEQPIAKIARAFINKPAWYQQFTIDKIRISNISEKMKAQRLDELKNKGKNLEATFANIHYIPLSQLFDSKGKANAFLFKQIPHTAIIEIIRPNWNLKDNIGTCLNVSHMGFAIWKNGELFYREASSTHHKIVDIPLTKYLREYLTSPTVKGINIQVIIPREPLGRDCKAKI